ncbi:transmembrane protein 136-like isoform X2 [Acanthaster planci]|uniref:Transmembrane protein 136-like isoform X2 n=1 Tax=Acanthaster planci TaxID=133434 RepID=A0A8B7XYU0_ACAPL|nr:transmembrane protein 136-like isoform X2 [Acanthaster planci]
MWPAVEIDLTKSNSKDGLAPGRCLIEQRKGSMWTPTTEAGGKSNPYENSTMVVCNGYFLYDFIRSMLYDTRHNRAMVLHHLVCILFTSASLVSGLSGTEINFSLFLAELTNPMLQIRWLMRNAGITEGILYELNQVVFLVAFFIIRVGIGTYWIYHYLLHPVPHLFFKLGGILLYAVSIIFMGQIMIVAYNKLSPSGRKESSENLPALDKTKI